jgi:hypothetical protein
MKKIYLIIIPVFILLLTGCNKNKTLVCTRDNETTNNVLIRSNVNVVYNEEKLVSFELETITDLSKTNLLNDEFVESLIKSSKETTKRLEEAKGITTLYEKDNLGVKYTLKINYDELVEDEIKDFDQKLYNKTMKIEDIKNGYLKEWTCKD